MTVKVCVPMLGAIAAFIAVHAGPSPEPVESTVRQACAGEKADLTLIVEITIPGVVERRGYPFPMIQEQPDPTGASGISCGRIQGENADGMDTSGKLTSYAGGSVGIYEITGTSVCVSVSYYWKSPESEGTFDRRITVPLREARELHFDGGIVVATRTGPPEVVN